MPAPPHSNPPAALPIGEALAQSAPLARLRELLRQSNACYAAIAPHLPAGLEQHVRPGPVSDDGWTLMAANASVAAKLRQLLPRLEVELKKRDLQASAIRIRIQSS
jgi:hypothetical protein